MHEQLLKEKLSDEGKQSIISVITSLNENLEKINQHGKRADSIVKGMLQHSRSNSGENQLTDINALVDEFVKVSYQGIKAKDKQFNAAIQTEFDDTVGKINIVSQDIGRVLINILNNAFYSINEKKKQKGEDYNPTVMVTTKRNGDKVAITIRDNGGGISQKFVDKIYQPFFTTKPTGHGTGLGLSLSYDIIKAHNGELKVDSVAGEFAEFTIILKY
jgi:signal transduction histidine kinase